MNPNNVTGFLEALKLMGFGMAGIFVVIFLIYVSIKVLLKAFPVKNSNE